MSNQELDGIYNKYRENLSSFIKQKVSDEAKAEDILQEVFFKLIKARKDDKEIKNIQKRLFQVTRNTINDFYREHLPFSNTKT